MATDDSMTVVFEGNLGQAETAKVILQNHGIEAGIIDYHTSLDFSRVMAEKGVGLL